MASADNIIASARCSDNDLLPWRKSFELNNSFFFVWFSFWYDGWHALCSAAVSMSCRWLIRNEHFELYAESNASTCNMLIVYLYASLLSTIYKIHELHECSARYIHHRFRNSGFCYSVEFRYSSSTAFVVVSTDRKFYDAHGSHKIAMGISFYDCDDAGIYEYLWRCVASSNVMCHCFYRNLILLGR